MARRSIPTLDADLVEVVAFLKERAILPGSPTAITVESTKRIHRATHSLILWRFRLVDLPQHGQVFIEEIASDALQVLPQVLMGYGKTAKLLTRGVIENTLRHLYFSDHPIEFARMNRESKWYLTMESLFDYLKNHPAFMPAEPRFDAINRLSALYSELSAGVHGRTVQDLEMRTALDKIKCDDDALRKQTILIERCAEASCFLLAVFHWSQMRLFPIEDRRCILRTFPPRARAYWGELE